MTFQPPPPPPPPPGGPPAPPPPPPGAPPPPPPGGGYNPPPGGGYGPPSGGGGGAFDPKSVNPLDWAILGVGLLTLIFSWFGVYKFSSNVLASQSYSAWHDVFGGGFLAWIGMVFAVLGTAALAVLLFAPRVALPMPARALAFLGFALGFLCELLAIFIHPKFASQSTSILGQRYHASFGHGFSFWVLLILTAAGTVLALMRAQQTGTNLPGPMGSLPKIGR
ncbi:MAG TPA: hypothetical protein VGN35_08015 [Jatrophihabitantaceae bacterium]|nr:hypothetical protein [Jatrophihabitantaceae bacterium]